MVHGEDGLDEITTAGATRVAEANKGMVRLFEVAPADFGLRRCDALEQLRGGTARGNADLIRAVFKGETGARLGAARDLIVANAAAAIVAGGLEDDLRTAAQRAEEGVRSGAALRKLKALAARTTAPST